MHFLIRLNCLVSKSYPHLYLMYLFEVLLIKTYSIYKVWVRVIISVSLIYKNIITIYRQIKTSISCHVPILWFYQRRRGSVCSLKRQNCSSRDSTCYVYSDKSFSSSSSVITFPSIIRKINCGTCIYFLFSNNLNCRL